MACIAIVDRYISSRNIRENSLRIIDKYHFDDNSQAKFFVVNLKKLDNRVIDTQLIEA